MAMAEEKLGGIRNQERTHAHKIAPIAALFEDCLQCFAELCTIMEVNEDAWKPQHVMVDGSFSKFRDWGRDTLAFNRSLDHALRKASRLQETTKDMLETLLSTLHDSKRLMVPQLYKFLIPVRDTQALDLGRTLLHASNCF